MDYNKLLDFVVDLGYELSMSGAETYRVEESVSRILSAYSTQAEVFAIPNCLHVSILPPDGKPLTRMRRVGFHGNDLDGVELFSGLSRRICAEKPDADTAMQWLQDARTRRRKYGWQWQLAAYFIASAAFTVFFGGGFIDALCGGLSGLVVGLSVMFMDKFQANNFFKTLLASIPLVLIPSASGVLGICPNPDAATIGAVMMLMPGLLFTYAMRDIIFGDTNSGINRIVQVLLIAVAIASGTALGWNIARGLWGTPVSAAMIGHSLATECMAAALGCISFCILFNAHGKGSLLCVLGGVLGWIVYRGAEAIGGSSIAATLASSIFIAVYSEVMARIRKYPAISYLVIAMIPLIPGSSLYYTINCIVRDDMAMFSRQGMQAIESTGLLAAGILVVSTTVRMWNQWKMNHRKAR